MIKYFLLFITTAISISTQSQTGNTGIGTSTPNALLDISSQNPATPSNQDGILIPRINVFPLTNPGITQHGMMIYLTSTAGINPPGFYYWDFNTPAWKPIGNGLFWSLGGNSGTVPAFNFLGTRDNIDVVFRRNNIQSGLIGFSTSWGYNSLQPYSTGVWNTAIGNGTLNSNTSGTGNTALGSSSLYSNSEGDFNTAIGASTMFGNITGTHNTAVGFEAGMFNTSGHNNTAIGYQSLRSNRSGVSNVAIGPNAMFSALGSNNTALGNYAGNRNINGTANVFIGYYAGYNELGSNKLYIHNYVADPLEALLYGEFDNMLLRTNARMEVNSNSTAHDGFRVIKNYGSGTNQNRIAVLGVNLIDDQYGIGVSGRGGYVGVDGLNVSIGVGTHYGTRGRALAVGSGTNIGIYGEGYGGLTNFAGYFEGNTYTSGNVDIGSGFSKLSINGGGGDVISILNGGDVRIFNTDGSASCLFYAQGGSGANNSTLVIASDGKSFSFNGAGGTVSSDVRLKQDITPIHRSLEKLMQLNGYSYRFKTKANIEKKEIGILAQEVLKVLPEAVFTNEDGTYSVSYNSLVPLLINGMKDQQKIIEIQDERIKKLEHQMSSLINKK